MSLKSITIAEAVRLQEQSKDRLSFRLTDDPSALHPLEVGQNQDGYWAKITVGEKTAIATCQPDDVIYQECE